MKRLATAVALSALGCVSTTTSAPTVSPAAYSATVAKAATKHMEQFERLQNVWYRLTSANAGRCLKTRLMAGYWYANLATLPQPYRSAWTAKYGPSQYVTVTHVVAESPADKAGLLAGDRIVAIDGKNVGTGRPAERRLRRSPMLPHYTLTVLRDGIETPLYMASTRNCNYSAALLENPEINAFADGTSVAVTTGAMEFVKTDEELAYLLGHELAHNAYGHLAAVRANRFLGALVGAVATVATGIYQDYSDLGAFYHAPKFEVEADYVGVYLAARSGYDVRCVSAFWRNMIAKNPGAAWAASLTHPDGSSRLHVLDATAAEILQKREAGRQLVPNVKGELDDEVPVDVVPFLAETDCEHL